MEMFMLQWFVWHFIKYRSRPVITVSTWSFLKLVYLMLIWSRNVKFVLNFFFNKKKNIWNAITKRLRLMLFCFFISWFFSVFLTCLFFLRRMSPHSWFRHQTILNKEHELCWQQHQTQCVKCWLVTMEFFSSF